MASEAEVREAYHQLTNALIERGLTVTTMESCTCGQVASLITDTEGASAILKGAFITYSNEAKVAQGVPAEVIARFGVYSDETARAMALACQRAYAADIGIGVTGTMGNVDPANGDSVPGKAYFAIAFQGSVRSFGIQLPPQDSRYAYKLAVAWEIAGRLREIIGQESNAIQGTIRSCR